MSTNSHTMENTRACFERISESRSSVEIYVDRKTYIQKTGPDFGLSANATALLDDYAFAKVTTLCNGNHAVIWQLDISRKKTEFTGRVINPTFHTLTNNFLIAEPETYAGPYAVVALTNGGFVVAWQELTKTGSRSRIRVFDSAGNPTSAPSNLSNAGDHSYSPTVYALPETGFVVLWVTSEGTKLRTFDNGGAPKSQAILIEPTDLTWRPFGYVTENGIINVFLRRSDDPGVDFYTGPNTTPFQLARSFDSKGNPLTGTIKTLAEMQQLAGYRQVLEQLVELTGYQLDNVLRIVLRNSAVNHCNSPFRILQATSRKQLTENPRMKSFFAKYCSLWRERCPKQFHGQLEQQYNECTRVE